MATARAAAAAAFLASVLALPSAAGASGYRYYGTVAGLQRLAVSLDAAELAAAGDHAAAYLGAASPGDAAWVQGGVEQTTGELGPRVYVEARTTAGRYLYASWPARLGRRVPVRLLRRGARWRAVAAGHASRWVRVPRARTAATLETLGPVAAAAHLGRRVVVAVG